MTILSKKTDQSGRSMVEMLGVLAIIGVLSVGGISGYSKAMAKFKMTKAQDQITMLLMNIRTAYATSPSYSGLNSRIAIEYNLAPQEMAASTASTGTLYGAFGGEVVVGTLSDSNNYFYIQIKALGKEACRGLLTSDWGADGLVKIVAQSSGSQPAAGCTAVAAAKQTGTWCTANLPVHLSDAGTVCNAETTDLTWVYY